MASVIVNRRKPLGGSDASTHTVANAMTGAPLMAMEAILSDRSRAFWLFQILGWLGYVGVRVFNGFAGGYGLEYLGTIAVGTLAGFILSTLMRYIYREVKRRSLAVVVITAIAVSSVFALIFSAIEISALIFYDPVRWQEGGGLFGNAMFDAFVLLSWSALYFGFDYYRQLQLQREATLRASAMAHEAQLAMLRYQLNPHFLFNTLNAISTLVLEKDTSGANNMLNCLSSFLRYSLVNQPTQKVTLENELHALSLYLDIERVRFEDRLGIDINVDEKALNALIPNLLLQPMIENAIKYAIAPQIDGGTITVGAKVKGPQLHLWVRDNGPGLSANPEKNRNSTGTGVGLANTKARLKEIYGVDHSFTLSNVQPRGLEVYMVIPKETEQSDDKGQDRA